MPMSVQRRSPLPPFGRRGRAYLAVIVARVLATRSPARMRAILTMVSRGARPADQTRALLARQDVTAVSMVCRGARGCLPRSIATALVCRLSGTWPTWCAGVRAVAPFSAHAWVEAEGRMVGEIEPDGYFRPLIVVGPADPAPPPVDDRVPAGAAR
jgi:hypothetical protein